MLERRTHRFQLTGGVPSADARLALPDRGLRSMSIGSGATVRLWLVSSEKVLSHPWENFLNLLSQSLDNRKKGAYY